MGETGTSAIVPAIANAILSLTAVSGCRGQGYIPTPPYLEYVSRTIP
jgi:hypothetical protein